MLRLPKTEYLEPRTVKDACSILSTKEGAKLLAGGTDLLVSMKQRVWTPAYVVGLKAITQLAYIDYDEKKGLRIGALTTLRDLVKSPVIQSKYPVIAHSAKEAATLQIQNMGTLGGNICLDTRCWYYNQSHFWRQSRAVCHKLNGDVCHVIKGSKECWAAYCGDTAPGLIALGAKVKLENSKGERVVALKDFFTRDGKNPNVLKSDEVMTEIQVPPLPPHSGTAYLKLRLRKAIDFPMVGAAVFIQLDGKDGICKDARVVVNAVDTAPLEVEEAAKALQGKKFTDDALKEAQEASYKKVRPVPNMGGGSPTYRRKMVRVFVERAARQALELAKSS
ncbi:MAG: FAD binding domain-containing protein [Chloroflexi bacterium]|nr:FAD binding domain-containing protein [Chloroflexota bacterium]